MAGSNSAEAEANARGSRVTPETQAIRVATTMTGGVSLAIWMGGVARELDLLYQASQWRSRLPYGTLLPALAEAASESERVRHLYLGLIDLLDVTVDLDVFAGTSAGGLNSAILAYARVNSRDLGGLRDVWLSVGSLMTLLRDPSDQTVPSLLLGDEQMYGGLVTRLPALNSVRGLPPDPDSELPSTTLFVTTTLLTGETSRFTDSFGTLVQDVDHHGLFTFDKDALSQPATVNALALAARSSASYPAAFEPSFLPFLSPTPATGKVPLRPAMAPFTPITRAHWAADGGLLNNKPIGPLLQTVFDQPADSQVRRLLLYVIPLTGKSPNPVLAIPDDDVTTPYGLVDGLLKEFESVLGQSIARDLQLIRQHNDRVSVSTDMRLRLAEIAGKLEASNAQRPPEQAETRFLSDELLVDYREREAQSLAQTIVPALLRQLATWPAENGLGKTGLTIPAEWQKALVVGGNYERACRAEVVRSAKMRWQAEPTDLEAIASYGRAGYDGAKAIAIAVVRAAFQQAHDGSERSALAALVRQIHDALPAEPPIDLARFVAEQCVPDSMRALQLPDAAAQIALLYLDRKDGRSAENSAASDLPDGWQRLAQALVDQHEQLADLANRDAPRVRPAVGTAAPNNALATYVSYLQLAEGSAPAVAVRLFQLFAAHRAMLPTEADVEQPVELVQVSADTRSLLAPGLDTAAGKLTGVQFHHFGAFYKQSWRANDWMWGRLDGAGWLVHLLLDPRRILQRATAEPSEQRVGWFLGELGKLGVPALPAAGKGPQLGSPDAPVTIDVRTIQDELQFLADPTRPVPDSLPLTAMWVAQIWQSHIAADELPHLADTILSPQNDASRVDPRKERIPAESAGWAEKVKHAASTSSGLFSAAGSLLAESPVSKETLAGDSGSPLMIRTVAKAAAVAAAALNSVKQIPTVVKPALSAVRTMTLAGYRLTNAIKPVPRTMILAGLVPLVIGIVSAVQSSTFFGLAGMTLIAIGAYLVVFGAWQCSRLVLAAVVSATLVGTAAALTVQSTRHALFGSSETDQGVVGRNVRWIGSAWWHPLVVLGVLLLAISFAGVVLDPVGRHRPRTRPVRGRAWPQWVPVVAAALVAILVLGGLITALVVTHDGGQKKAGPVMPIPTTPTTSAPPCGCEPTPPANAAPKATPQLNTPAKRSMVAAAAGVAAALPVALAIPGLATAADEAAAGKLLVDFTHSFLTKLGETLGEKAGDFISQQVNKLIDNLEGGPGDKPDKKTQDAVCLSIQTGLSTAYLAALKSSPVKGVPDADLTALVKSATDPVNHSAECATMATIVISLDPSISAAEAETAAELAEITALLESERATPAPPITTGSVPGSSPSTQLEVHSVKAGETLWSIASSRVLPGSDNVGISMAWVELWSINEDIIGPNPNLIFPGTVLRLPS